MARLSRRELLKGCAGGVALTAGGSVMSETPTVQPGAGPSSRPGKRPNFVFILVDDLRYDAVGHTGKTGIITPNMDSLAKRGTWFSQAIVTTSICSPSRACCLTGRYCSANGVPGLGGSLNPGERTIAQYLKEAGYQTALVGKWHIARPLPAKAGFDFVTYFMSNGPHYDRKVIEAGEQKVAKGFIEDYNADQAVRFMEAAVKKDAPFLLHLCTQAPHMTGDMTWEARPETLAMYDESRIPVPGNWQDDLSGKPPYLKEGRHRAQGAKYGYGTKEGIRKHKRQYFSTVTEMDASLGKVLAAMDRLGVRDNTYVFLMGDNGWMMGEHGFTSKVLPYEESIRVPFLIAGPGTKENVDEHLVTNADIAPTMLELAGLAVPANMHGTALTPLLKPEPCKWRDSVLYEAPEPELTSWPLLAVRTREWKYVQTFDIGDRKKLAFEELYDLKNDPGELKNLAGAAAHRETQERLEAELDRLRKSIRTDGQG